MKALAKEPDQRYDSPAELAHDVDNFLQGEQVIARPPSFLYVCSKFIRRHRVATSIVAAVAGSILISLIAVTWGYFQSQENLSDARSAKAMLNNKATALSESLSEVDAQRRRADENAARMSLMLKRSILENAWVAALDGDSPRAQSLLGEIAEENRDSTWQFVQSVSNQTDWRSLRSESAGPIRVHAIDGQHERLAIVTTGSRLEIWDLAGGDREFELQLDAHIYSSLAFSADGERLLAAHGDQLILVDLATRQVEDVLAHGKGGTRTIVFDQWRDRWLLTTGANYLLAVSDDGKKTLAQQQLPARLSRVKLLDSGNLVLVAGIDGRCFVLTAEDFTRFNQIAGSQSNVVAMRLRGDTLWAANSSADVLKLPIADIRGLLVADRNDDANVKGGNDGFDALTGNTELTWTTFKRGQQPDHRHTAIELTNAGDLIVGDRLGSVLYLASRFDSALQIRKYFPAVSELTLLNESESGGSLLVVHFNGRVNLVSAADLAARLSYVGQLQDLSDGVALQKTRGVLTAHQDGMVRSWHSETGQLSGAAKLHQTAILSLDVDETRERIATMGADRKVVVSNLRTLAVEQLFSVSFGVRPVRFSPNGRWLAAAPDVNDRKDLSEGAIDLWEIATGQPEKRLVGHGNWVTQIEFNRAGTRLASWGLDGAFRYWNILAGDCELTIDMSDAAPVAQFALLSDDVVAFGHTDGSVSIRSLGDGTLIREAHIVGNSIDGLIAPRNADCLIVSTSSDSSLSFLHAATLEPLAKFDAGTGRIAGLKLDQESTRLQVLGDSGAIQIWDLPKFSD